MLGTEIGSAKMVDGLYQLPACRSEFRQTPRVASLSTQGDPLNSNKESEVMLSHFRLGHPNFVYLKKLFPSLFINKKPSLFQCEVCQLSKHSRTSYPMHPYAPSQPFSLVHSDIWGG